MKVLLVVLVGIMLFVAGCFVGEWSLKWRISDECFHREGTFVDPGMCLDPKFGPIE